MSHFYDNYNPACSILEFPDDPWFGLDNPKPFSFFHFSYEGVSIKGQDDVNHIFSLNLSDGESGGFADYVEIRLRDDNTDFINQLSELEGVGSAVLVSYNGDYMG